MKTETEIRERIKDWEYLLQRAKEKIDKGVDVSKSQLQKDEAITTLITLRWVLNETK